MTTIDFVIQAELSKKKPASIDPLESMPNPIVIINVYQL